MIDRESLRDALLRTGRGRELQLPGSDAVLDRWCQGLDEFIAYYQNRFRETIDPFEWLKANLAKARAFFEPDTLSLSAEMKTAVWRILLGFDIRKVELLYQPGGISHLRMELSPPRVGEIDVFESNAAEDAKLLRHLGSIRVNGQFELQGYHGFATAVA
jgi:hypothetical protein